MAKARDGVDRIVELWGDRDAALVAVGGLEQAGAGGLLAVDLGATGLPVPLASLGPAATSL